MCAHFLAAGRDLELMGDEKDTWKVKTLDEILQEKKRRRELEEKTEPKRLKNVSSIFFPRCLLSMLKNLFCILIIGKYLEIDLKTKCFYSRGQ